MAQSTSGDLAIDQYRPSPFSDRGLELDGTTVLPFGQYRIGADIDVARRALILEETQPGIFQGTASGAEHALISLGVGASLGAVFGLGHRLEAAVQVPLTLYQTGDTPAGARAPSIAGLGNLTLGVKARAVTWKGLGAGAAVLVSIPGGIGKLTHDAGFGGEARGFTDFHRGRFGAGLSVGFRLRPSTTLYDIPIGNELTFAAGASLKLFSRTSVLAEIDGATAASSPFGNGKQTPVEALAGLRQRLGKLWLTAAAGPGLVDGYGSPTFRAVAGLTWANVPPDADGDGISDDDDRCPEDPEDRDGFEDSDGCPDPDNDKDGLLDAQDKCPNDAEDKDGFEDEDGCPDPDNDKDGILDVADKCPDKPETKNGFEDEDGCPDEKPPSDRDNDGILDEKDECPDEAEDKDGFEDEDGCPDPDNDKDGILDASDKCPLEPETINGVDDDDGCPDKGAPQVRLGDTEIETLKPVYFDTDRSRVRHAFYNILGQVASMLKAHPEIGRCAVEGHTDSTGPADWNQKLSEMRAQSVVEFLAQKGVERSRLVPIGHAEKLPWVSNDTPEGRAQNRRVMFHIEGVSLEQQQKDLAREERRRLIRIEKERERQKEREAARAGAPETEESGSEDAAAPGGESGTKKRDEKDEHGGAGGGAGEHPGPGGPAHQSSGEGAHEPSPAHDKTAAAAEQEGHGDEGKPASGKAPEARPGDGRPHDAPPLPTRAELAKAEQAKANANAETHGAPAPSDKPSEKGSEKGSAKPGSGEATKTDTTKSETVPKQSAKPYGPAAPENRRGRRADAGMPASLKELLKLPPR